MADDGPGLDGADDAVTEVHTPATLRASAERAEDRLRRLQRITLDLTAAVSLDDVVAAVVDVLEPPVATPARGLWVWSPGSEFLELVAQRGIAEDAADR